MTHHADCPFHDLMGTSPDDGPALPRVDAPDDARVRVYAARLREWMQRYGGTIVQSPFSASLYWHCRCCGEETPISEHEPTTPIHTEDCLIPLSLHALAANDDQIAALVAEMDGGES